MTTTVRLSQQERAVLEKLLQSRIVDLERASQWQGESQAESARRTLQQDADDASQRAGAQEVEGIVADIDSSEFKALSDALQRIHSADYGRCVDCNDAVPFNRLELEPQTLRCAACQTRHELTTQP